MFHIQLEHLLGGVIEHNEQSNSGYFIKNSIYCVILFNIKALFLWRTDLYFHYHKEGRLYHMPITVDTILKLPLFSSTTLIGGFQGVGREVLSANITDSPDIANWIRPNQFLLTTAYNYKDEPESLIPFLHQLCAYGFLGSAPHYLVRLRLAYESADRLPHFFLSHCHQHRCRLAVNG